MTCENCEKLKQAIFVLLGTDKMVEIEELAPVLSMMGKDKESKAVNVLLEVIRHEGISISEISLEKARSILSTMTEIPTNSKCLNVLLTNEECKCLAMDVPFTYLEIRNYFKHRNFNESIGFKK